jgi:hypothetical protein
MAAARVEIAKKETTSGMAAAIMTVCITRIDVKPHFYIDTP